MGEKYTNLQVWKVMRELVSENNAYFRKIYASSVRGYINGYIQRNGLSPKAAEIEKNKIISKGMSEIYESIATNFLDIDKYTQYEYGTQQARYFDLKSAGKNWVDQLSVKDLFVLFTFQNKVISQIRKIDNLDKDAIISTINKTGFISAFGGHVQFYGKPQRTEGDKVKIDTTNEDVRVDVIGQLTQHYCGSTQQAINGVALGKHSTDVIQRYFVAREQGAQYYDQRHHEQHGNSYIKPQIPQGTAARYNPNQRHGYRSQMEISRLAHEAKRETPRPQYTQMTLEEGMAILAEERRQRELAEAERAAKETVVPFVELKTDTELSTPEIVEDEISPEELDELRASLEPKKEMIGINGEGYPVFEVTDPEGNVTYETSIGEPHEGAVYIEDEDNHLIFLNDFGGQEQ